MNSKMDDALKDEVKEQIREAFLNIKTRTTGFRDRPSQRKLTAEVARTISGFYGERRILVAEAPTGTGKSIGYMLSAIPVAKSKDKRLIIATGTVALQEQLVYRDIPSLQERSGMDFSFVLAKGRGRYACNRNIAELTNSDARQASLIEDDSALNSAAWPFIPASEQVKLVMDMEKKLASNLWHGDLDEWKGDPIDNDMRQIIATDHGGCLGRNCSFFFQCGFQKSRQAMRKADVIVANHDLVMADINLGGGAILPAPNDSIYVFDEAHHLPDVALAHGASSSHVRRSVELASKTSKVLSEALSALKISPKTAKTAIDEVRQNVETLEKALKEAESFIRANFPAPVFANGRKGPAKGEPVTWRFENGVSPEALRLLSKNINDPATRLCDVIDATLTKMREAFKKQTIDQNMATKAGKNLSLHAQRFAALKEAWSMMSEPDEPGKPPVARWIVYQPLFKGKREDYQINCSPTSAADQLRRLWNEASGVVLASATITALGTFQRFAERAGLSMRDGTQFLQLPSPFNYQDNAELHIPDLRADPSNPNEHTLEVAEFLNHNVDLDQGTLVLFSARKQMMDVAEKITADIKAQLLVQGELSKNEILDAHRKRIKEGKGSVIFGLASFSEGVDLPGKLCEHVIIAKLPFAVPDSPIDATYSEWLESVGRNPFMEISVPDACTKLVQACGRLIRTESDRGRVTLLDKRIVTKRYGKQILDALPPFKRIYDPIRQSA